MVNKSRNIDPRKIMIRATNWVGDAIMSLPALEALRARFPRAEIVLVGKPWVVELYAHQPAVNRKIIYDASGEHRGRQGWAKLIRVLREEEFDTAILLQNAFQAAWMAWRARIPCRIGYARDGRSALLTDPIPVPPPAAYGHQSAYYLQLLFRAGLIDRVDPPPEIRLVLHEAEQNWAARQLAAWGLQGPRFLVGLNPGAAFGPAKRWLAERFAAVADQLVRAYHADVLIFGAAAERPVAEAVAKAMEHAPTIVAGETTLRQWMALLSRCRLVLANDSGPMHVAAALGLPLVAVFGSTDERATGPLGPHTRVVKQPVPCSPCGLRECPIDFRCMREVTVDMVLAAVADLLSKYRLS